MKDELFGIEVELAIEPTYRRFTMSVSPAEHVQRGPPQPH